MQVSARSDWLLVLSSLLHRTISDFRENVLTLSVVNPDDFLAVELLSAVVDFFLNFRFNVRASFDDSRFKCKFEVSWVLVVRIDPAIADHESFELRGQLCRT